MAAIREGFLDMLCCPEDRVSLREMTGEELAALNATIARGGARYSGGGAVAGPLDAGLATADGASVYEVREGVPVLLAGRRIHQGEDAGTGATFHTRAVDAATEAQWEALASYWPTLRPPQRPGPDDIALMGRLVGESLAATRSGGVNALLLGVTPEIATMRWPDRTRLLAVDFSAAMIRALWRGAADGSAAAVRGDWTMMPVRDECCDVVVGDANLSTLAYPDEYVAIAREVRRVVRDTGALVLRLFARPEPPESLETIFSELRAGRISRASLLPARIAMALHGDLATGVRPASVWDAWREHVPNPAELLASLGWPPEAENQVKWFVERPIRFPTVGEVADLLAPDFYLAASHACDYETADRYPSVLFRPRKCSPGAGRR